MTWTLKTLSVVNIAPDCVSLKGIRVFWTKRRGWEKWRWARRIFEKHLALILPLIPCRKKILTEATLNGNGGWSSFFFFELILWEIKAVCFDQIHPQFLPDPNLLPYLPTLCPCLVLSHGVRLVLPIYSWVCGPPGCRASSANFLHWSGSVRMCVSVTSFCLAQMCHTMYVLHTLTLPF